MKLASLVGSCLIAFGVCAAEPVNLSSLDLTNVTAGWGTVHPDQSIGGKGLSIGGKKFATGIGTHAPSKLRVELAGAAQRFQAQVGVDDSGGTKGSVQFVIEGDGKPLWKSDVMQGGQKPASVDVNVGGVRVLVLRVTDGGDGTSHDHADWANAQIVMSNGSKPRTLPPQERFTLKTKTFALNFEIGDDGRLYQQPIGSKPETAKRSEEAYPQSGDGYIWEPALQVTHADGNTSTTLVFDEIIRTTEAAGRELVCLKLHDPAYPFQASLFFRLHHERDLVEQWVEIQHQEKKPVKLERMASASLLLNPENVHLTHFHGDWADEMNPVTEKLTHGTKIVDSKIAVRAHFYRHPHFLLGLDGPATETSGRVLAGSLAWSGSFQCAFDHFGPQVRALCGVNPFGSAYYLKPKEKFTTPVMLWAWSDSGLGNMSRSFHAWAREFGVRDGNEPRQVLLNNWEATAFDFDFDRIAGLFQPAREMGVELFLLDDGWFGNKHPRTNDNAGLGDWEPNRKRLPNGVAPLAKAALDTDLRFGIWIEPEMVNPRSELYEKHPDWTIRQPKRELDLYRNQLVLDLTRPAVQEFEWNIIKDVFGVPGVSYVKWDANRYLTQPGSPWLAADRQSHLQIEYVRALYALMEKTMKTYPETELMLCSGGGGRADYGALRYFHEFWPSDNTDPVRRVTMQWDYSYFFPAMTLSSHVTHWGRRPMHFACAVAMSARFGMDLDLAKLTPDEKAVCSGAIKAYKQIRDVIHLGELYRLERPHDAVRGAINYVSLDKARAALFVFQLKDGEALPAKPQGLDPARRYTVRELNPAPGRAALAQEGKTFTGEELMRDGVIPGCSKTLEASAIELSSQP